MMGIQIRIILRKTNRIRRGIMMFRGRYKNIHVYIYIYICIFILFLSFPIMVLTVMMIELPGHRSCARTSRLHVTLLLHHPTECASQTIIITIIRKLIMTVIHQIIVVIIYLTLGFNYLYSYYYHSYHY